MTPEEQDVLTELVNVGIGRAACSLSEMIDSHVGLKVPNVRTADPSGMIRVTHHQDLDCSAVLQGFSGALSGTAVLVFPTRSARSLVALLTGAQEEAASWGDESRRLELDVERAAVLTEVGNIIINAVLGSLGNLASLDLTFGLPRYEEGIPASLDPASGKWSVVVGVLFQIKEHAVEGELSVVFERATLGSVWHLLDPSDAPAEGQA